MDATARLDVNMIELRPLPYLSEADFLRLVSGYVSLTRYAVQKRETLEHTTFTLELQRLDQPYRKQWEYIPQELVRYNGYLKEGYSLGAFEGERLVAIAIVEPREWNKTLWVWEFHVEERWRGQGIGQQLMEAVAGRAREAGLRALVVETQNTNVPAILFYRKVGFEIEGIDLSYYTNHDTVDGEVAIFMKLKL